MADNFKDINTVTTLKSDQVKTQDFSLISTSTGELKKINLLDLVDFVKQQSTLSIAKDIQLSFFNSSLLGKIWFNYNDNLKNQPIIEEEVLINVSGKNYKIAKIISLLCNGQGVNSQDYPDLIEKNGGVSAVPDFSNGGVLNHIGSKSSTVDLARPLGAFQTGNIGGNFKFVTLYYTDAPNGGADGFKWDAVGSGLSGGSGNLRATTIKPLSQKNTMDNFAVQYYIYAKIEFYN